MEDIMSLISLVYYNIVPFIVVLSLLVFVHEWGHYLAARWNDVRVEVFSIGFGPEMFGWTDRNGTRWKISLVPLGGYVKMFSDLNPASQPDQKLICQMSEEDKKVSLFHKTVWQRIAVSAAGPLANYLFAVLIFGTLYIFSGQKILSELAKIGQVMPESAAEHVGLQPGDLVLDVNGKALKTFYDQVKHSPLTAYFHAIKDVYDVSARMLVHLGQMIVGKRSADALSGPVGIAALTGEVARKSITDLIWLAALLSINLGLINLFPVPVLDGGHLLFYFMEAIRGKPVSEKIQESGYRIGFGLIIMLVVISTWNDLYHLKVFEFFKNIFN